MQTSQMTKTSDATHSNWKDTEQPLVKQKHFTFPPCCTKLKTTQSLTRQAE